MGCQSNMEQAIEPVIIPKPLFQKNKNGFFTLDKQVYIQSDPALNEVINYLKSNLKENYNYRFSEKKSAKINYSETFKLR